MPALQTHHRLIFLFAFSFCVFWLTYGISGLGVSPDSVDYLCVAKNFSYHLRLSDCFGQPHVVQPPLYPILVGISGKFTNSSFYFSTGVLNAAIYALLMTLLWVFFQKNLYFAPWYVFFIPIFFSIPLVKVFSYAWSEPLYILFTVAGFLLLERYLLTRRSFYVMALGVCTGACSLTRYIGISNILWAALSLIFFKINNKKIKKTHILLYVATSLSPFLFWIFRNFHMSGTFFGPREASRQGLQENIGLVYKQLLSWIFPFESHSFLYKSVLISVFILFVVFFLTARAWKKISLIIQSVIFWTITYTAFLIITSTTTKYNKIDIRLLSPIYISLVIWIFSLIGVYVADKIIFKRHKYLFLVTVFLTTLHPLIYVGNDICRHFAEGTEYSAYVSGESEMTKYILKNKQLFEQSDLYSNFPKLVYLTTGFVPRFYDTNSSAFAAGAEDKAIKKVLVWYKIKNRVAFLDIKRNTNSIQTKTLFEKSGDWIGIMEKSENY